MVTQTTRSSTRETMTFATPHNICETPDEQIYKDETLMKTKVLF